MDADVRTAKDLFFAPVQFEIPIFQRPYVWDEEEQWQPLWDDISETAGQWLDPLGDSKLDHFLGAIVIQDLDVTVGETPHWTVIDGQQRLTTLQIVLDAAELEMRIHEPTLEARHANRLHRLILNDEDETGERIYTASDPEQFKVWPSATDREVFRRVMTTHDPDIDDDDSARLGRAHGFFRQQVRDWLDEEGFTPDERADALVVTLRDKLKLVAIQLNHADRPNVIFEALNARGTPLLDWDLAKNFLLHKHNLSGGDVEALHRRFIVAIDADEWWRQDVGQGSQSRPRADVFLHHWLTMARRRLIPVDKVFTAFGDLVDEWGENRVASELHRLSRTYKRLETMKIGDPSEPSELSQFVERWQVLQARVFTPHLLWLLSHEVDGEVLRRSLQALESFLVRRTVCRVNAMGLNRALPELLVKLDEAGPEAADSAIIEFLSNHPARIAVWPSDAQFREHLEDGPIYLQLTRRRTRMLLEAIEKRLFSKFAAPSQPPNLTIEHVMPRKWQTNWALPRGTGMTRAELIDRREHLIHTLGNLSLTTGALGSRLSNNCWRHKRPDIKKHDNLFLNKHLLEHVEGQWSEDSIVHRGKRLADLAVEIWPPPEKI